MDNSFSAYLQILELMAFFTGYPLLYILVIFVAGQKKINADLKKRMVLILPYSYALVGTLYLGLQLRNLYPDYSIGNIKNTIQYPLLVTAGLLSLLFWIRWFAKKIFISLIHSILFFFLIIKDLFLQLFSTTSNMEILRNDMKIYTDSMLLNLGAFICILLLSFLFTRYIRVTNHNLV